MLKYFFLILFSLLSLNTYSTCKSFFESKELNLKYAKHFQVKINEADGTWWIRVGIRSKKNWYAINTKDSIEQLKKQCKSAQLIIYPNHLLLTSTTQLSAFSDLDQENKVKAFLQSEMISNSNWRKKLINYPRTINPELLIRDQIDLILSYDSEILSNEDLMKKSRIKKIHHFQVIEYLENHPLARMEWIKLYGILTKTYPKSVQIFNVRESSYWNSVRSVKNVKPAYNKIILGEILNEKWVYPNEFSDSISILKDLSLEVVRPKSVNKKLGPDFYNFEEVVAISSKAKVWITQNIFTNKKMLLSSNYKYKSLENLKIINISQKVNADGYSDYWETAVNRPDLLIKDYIYFFYPDTLKQYNPLWLNELK